MEELQQLRTLFQPQFTLDDVARYVDILLVAFVVYRLLLLIRGTRAWRIVVGILLFVAVWGVSERLHLYALHLILDKATLLGPVALVILLLPEMRHALEGMGKLVPPALAGNTYIPETAVDEIVRAMALLTRDHVGALIVLQGDSPMDDVVASGVGLNARLSAVLLESLFYEGNPLHDGAVVVRGDTIVAAACRLPLSDARMDSSLHMRHRAAVGATESFDCISLVASEERGVISVSREGHLERMSGPDELRTYLELLAKGREPGRTRKPARKKRQKGSA